MAQKINKHKQLFLKIAVYEKHVEQIDKLGTLAILVALLKYNPRLVMVLF